MKDKVSIQKLCQEAIEKQRKKIGSLTTTYNRDLNHPDLKTNNDYLDQMILEYLFYFDDFSRKTLLKKTLFKELEKNRQELL